MRISTSADALLLGPLFVIIPSLVVNAIYGLWSPLLFVLGPIVLVAACVAFLRYGFRCTRRLPGTLIRGTSEEQAKLKAQVLLSFFLAVGLAAFTYSLVPAPMVRVQLSPLVHLLNLEPALLESADLRSSQVLPGHCSVSARDAECFFRGVSFSVNINGLGHWVLTAPTAYPFALRFDSKANNWHSIFRP